MSRIGFAIDLVPSGKDKPVHDPISPKSSLVEFDAKERKLLKKASVGSRPVDFHPVEVF
jgi:hypothetical protein